MFQVVAAYFAGRKLGIAVHYYNNDMNIPTNSLFAALIEAVTRLQRPQLQHHNVAS
jgi:hypothetical protein